ncbi:MAG: hypothetical protein J6W79_01340 [Alphaproteobacteria bacterium]|nr:hypothetical protein [Alphaproteobacteria bacterium]
MKKLLMLMVCCFMAMPAFAADNCPAKGNLELQGLQNGKDDEFIYTNQSVYDEVLDCYSQYGAGGSKKVCNLTRGNVYECDNQQGCSDSVYLFGEGGWVHGRNGNDLGNKILQCMSKGTQDHWSVNDWKECPKQYDVLPDKVPGMYWTEIKFKNNSNMKCYRSSTQGYCCLDEEYANCLTAEHAIWSVAKQECLCGGTEAGAQTTGLWRWDGQKCVEYNEGSDPIKPQPGPEPAECTDGNLLYNGERCAKETDLAHPENVLWCVKYCEGGKWGEWLIHQCKDGYNLVDNKCVKKSGPVNPEPIVCTDKNGIKVASGKRGEIKCGASDVGAVKCSGLCAGGLWNDRRIEECDTNAYKQKPENGKCVKKADDNGGNGGGDEVWKCPPKDGYGDGYETCSVANILIVELRRMCADNRLDRKAYNDYINHIDVEIAKCKTQQDASDLKKRIGDLASRISIDDWRKSLTVWKTTEGDFNKARLASDSIAGVVLGTAGGLITSKVVKKSQVKSGFEDVQCTIGGQKVSDWGDEFTVGIQ